MDDDVFFRPSSTYVWLQFSSALYEELCDVFALAHGGNNVGEFPAA